MTFPCIKTEQSVLGALLGQTEEGVHPVVPCSRTHHTENNITLPPTERTCCPLATKTEQILYNV